MRNLLFTSVVAFCGLVLYACAGRTSRPDSNKADAGSLYAFTAELSDSLLKSGVSDTLDLGRMREGEVISQTIGLRNGGDTPVVILGVETSCGCTTVDYPRQPIMPGETEALGFRFDSRGEYGRQFKSFRIFTSASERPYRIYIKGEVI